MKCALRKHRDKAVLLLALFSSFFAISAVTVGGGAAMTPLIIDCAVRKRRWISEREAGDCLAVCHSLPGAMAINAGVYIGKKAGGVAGSLAAVLGTVAPSFIVIILAMLLIGSLGESPWLHGAFDGAKAAAAALVVVACLRIGGRIIKKAPDIALAAIAFAAVAFGGVSALIAIASGAVFGLVRGFLFRRKARR
ncbi:MAG: chromate transporter [Clostridiales Family XIII bacterium]|jgi:chromate transporter|nr:chromate transporter [Clostridiales Family XIII bacterium]